MGEEAGVERIRGHRRRCHAAAESAMWLPTPDTSRWESGLLGKAVTENPVSQAESSSLFVSLPLTSAGTHRMDEQRKSSNNGQALDEKSIRD